MKAQSSVEFMVAVAMLIFVIIALQLYIFMKANEAASTNLAVRGREVCDSIGSQLSLAGYSRGYSGELRVPRDVAGTPVNLTVHRDYVALDYVYHSCIRDYRAEVRFNGTSPPFTLPAGEYWVNNTDGVVYLRAK